MTDLYAMLKTRKACPVCGQAAMPVNARQEQMKLVRYECGAAFGVSSILNVIDANQPCPMPSQAAAGQMMVEADLVGLV
ncbi:hypothetical protein [Rhizobium paknamense]|uniref:Ribosomal protein S27AE n=1 Tax=Rhizobium paknamense TaxID=1206817 RepID=A0ABU0I8S1_9HYPH|nr:hypothetical protein [Rhizobium paknamense]MDQ0454631.1 ribosomal protein S27AE [Rhizobium paknamense]